MDTVTGFQGTATAVCYYLNSGPRVCLENIDNDGNIIQEWLDLPRLKFVAKGKFEATEIHP